MNKASALALLLRRDRSDVTALVLVLLLIAFTAFIAAAGFRLFQRTTDDALRRAVAGAPVGQRTVTLAETRLARDAAAIGDLEAWRADGEEQRADFPESVARLVDDGNIAIGSNRLRVGNPPDYPLYLTLRYQDDIDSVAQIVEGRWPQSTGAQIPSVATFPQPGSGGGQPMPSDHASDTPQRFEIAVRASTARALGLTVGAVYNVGIDLVDPILTNSALRFLDLALAPTELEVTGLYDVVDADSDAWFGDPRLAFDDLALDLDQPIADISAVVAGDALPGLMSSALPFTFQWRFPIDVNRLDADAVEETERGLRVFDAQFGGGSSGDVTADAGLLPLFVRHQVLRTGSESVLALAASAPVALAAAAMAMAAVLLSRRRREAMVLARGRGATSRMLFAASLIEAVAVAAVASIIGLVLAILLEPAADLAPSVVAVTSIGVIAVLVLMAAAWPQIRQPLSELEGSGRSVKGRDMRRIVLELVVVVLAIVGAYLLQQRGVTSPGNTPTDGGVGAAVAFDPFLAAVPAMIALAVGVIALRLYRPATAVAGWVADRRRDLIPVLGLRTIARGAASGMPVLVLLLAVAFAAFMSIVSNSVDVAQQNAAWRTVGADARIEPTGERRFLPTEAQLENVPGLAAHANGFIDNQVRPPANSGAGTMTFFAVDPVVYSEVVAGSPIEPTWPSAFLTPPSDATAQAPLPVILSTRLTGGQLRLGVGDTFQVIMRGRPLPLEVVEVRDSVPGVTEEEAFVVVPYTFVDQRYGTELQPNVMWIKADQAAIAPLTELVDPDVSQIRLLSRYDEYAALRDEPMVGAVGIGFALTLGVSVAYAVLTILGAVMLSAARRTRDVAILRTLGLASRQQTRLSIVEHAPPILVALPIGLALGIGVAFAVAPALGLGVFSGTRGSIALTIDWSSLAWLCLILTIVALSAVVIGTWLSRRAAIINALRITSD